MRSSGPAHRQAEEQFKDEETRYRRLLEAITSYTYSVTFDDGASFMRHGLGCLATTGYSPDEYAADFYLWIRIVHPEDREMVTAICRRNPGEARSCRPSNTGLSTKTAALVGYGTRSSIATTSGDDFRATTASWRTLRSANRPKQDLREREAHLLAAEAIQSRLWPKAPPDSARF